MKPRFFKDTEFFECRICQFHCEQLLDILNHLASEHPLKRGKRKSKTRKDDSGRMTPDQQRQWSKQVRQDLRDNKAGRTHFKL